MSSSTGLYFEQYGGIVCSDRSSTDATMQEPGDTFIADLNPRHHFDASSSSYGSVSFDGGRFLRLRDFSSLYGAVFGDMQMRKTGLWFIWDIAQMHEDVRNRVKGQGKTLTYSPRADGRAINMADVNEKGTCLCGVHQTLIY